jgi:LysM repeat protein
MELSSLVWLYQSVPCFLGVTVLPDNNWYRLGPALNKLPAGQEPKHAQPLGSPESEPFGIYISDETADFIGKYLLGNPQQEMGGILVGYVMQSHRPFIVICGAIEARYAQNIAGGVSFTEKSFDYMQRVWEREYPDTLVLGWFCSHVDAGVQLSGYDKLVQDRWFTQPWQVAFIVDTIRNASLFHCRRDGNMVPVEHFAVWNSHIDPIHTLTHQAIVPPVTVVPPKRESELLVPMTQVKVSEEEVASASECSRPVARKAPMIYWVLLLVVLLAFMWPSLPWSLPHLWSIIDKRQEQLQQLENGIDIGSNAATGGDTQAAPTDGLSDTIPISEAPTAARDPSTSAPQRSPDASEDKASLYTIEKGDTLWHISERTLGDPLQYPKLAETNQIADPSLIHPGTIIKVVP